MQHAAPVKDSLVQAPGGAPDWMTRDEDALLALHRAAARDRRGILCGYGVLLLLLLCLLLAARARRAARPPVTLSGAATPLPILARAADLCRSLGAGDGPLSLEAVSVPGRVRQWQVDCTDGAGGEFARFDWDADSGALSYVSRSGRPSLRGPVLGPAQAVRRARAWLNWLRLGAASPAGNPPWTLRGAPERSPSTWLVTWEVPGRRAMIHMDARTGALWHAEVWRPKQ